MSLFRPLFSFYNHFERDQPNKVSFEMVWKKERTLLGADLPTGTKRSLSFPLFSLSTGFRFRFCGKDEVEGVGADEGSPLFFFWSMSRDLEDPWTSAAACLWTLRSGRNW